MGYLTEGDTVVKRSDMKNGGLARDTKGGIGSKVLGAKKVKGTGTGKRPAGQGQIK